MKSELSRPKTVPAEATWIPDDNEWELGQKDNQSRNIGEWNWWLAPTGHLVCTATYSYDENNVQILDFIRYHPDGTISRKGRLIDGLGEGIHEFFRSDNPTEEVFTVLAEPHVWRTVTRLYRDRIVEEHYFDKNNQKAQESFYADSEGRENITRNPKFSETTYSLKSALKNKAYNEMIQICRHELKQPYLTNLDHQATLHYYECRANFERQFPNPLLSSYEISDELYYLALFALHHKSYNNKIMEVGFLCFVIGHYHFCRKDYKTAFIYLNFAMAEIDHTNVMPAQLVFSEMVELLACLGFPSLAFQLLYYANKEFISPKYNIELKQSAEYQDFCALGKQLESASETLKQEQIPSPSNAQEQMRNIVQKRQLTPIEAYQELPIDLVYNAKLQHQPCVLVIEQDVHWQGNFNLHELNEYLGHSTAEVYILMIKGNFTIDGQLNNVPHPLKLNGVELGNHAFQLVIFGDVQAKIIQNFNQTFIHGQLKCELLYTKEELGMGQSALLHAQGIDAQCLVCVRSAKIEGSYLNPKMMQSFIPSLPQFSFFTQKESIQNALFSAYNPNNKNLNDAEAHRLTDIILNKTKQLMQQVAYRPHFYRTDFLGCTTSMDHSGNYTTLYTCIDIPKVLYALEHNLF